MWAVMCVCHHVCHMQAWSCLSTGCALNRCFAWFLGPQPCLRKGGAGYPHTVSTQLVVGVAELLIHQIVSRSPAMGLLGTLGRQLKLFSGANWENVFEGSWMVLIGHQAQRMGRKAEKRVSHVMHMSASSWGEGCCEDFDFGARPFDKTERTQSQRPGSAFFNMHSFRDSSFLAMHSCSCHCITSHHFISL